VSGSITGIAVVLRGVTHPYLADVNALLVGPTGQRVLLLSDVGRAAANADLTFSDAAGGSVPAASAVPTGTYTPTDASEDCALAGADDGFPAPAPGGAYGSALNAAFLGTDPNGDWKLFLTDDCQGDSGQLASGWSLEIATGPTAVRVTRFTATRTRAGVRLRWRTAQETALLGFNVYRVVKGRLARLNRTVLPHRGQGTRGASYVLLDRRAPAGRPLSFRLQAVGLDGKKSWQGVARVKASRSVKGFRSDALRRLTATELTLACALEKNGSLRAVAALSECRKLEVGVTIAPGPVYVCVQADGSARKVAAPANCLAPGTLVTLPGNNDVYFCAGADGVLRYVAGSGHCTGGEVELVVTHVNTAPTDISLSPSTVAENQPVGTTVGTFSTTDPNSGDTFTYTFAGGADDGSFAIVGNTLQTNASFDFEAKASYSIRVRSTDQGGAFFEKTFTVTVSNVNEPPLNTVPAGQSVNEDTNLVFSSGNGNALSVADVDAGASPVKVSLDVLHGTLTLAATTGLTFVDGTSNGSASVHFTGTVANINSDLAGLVYKGTANYNSTRGAETLTMVTNDQGNTGSGGAQSDSDTVAITVNAVNDPPVAAAKAFNVGTNLTINLTGLLSGASDPDTGDGGYTASFTLASVTVGTCAGCTVSNLNAAAGSVDVDPPADTTGSLTLSYTITDSGNPGPAATSAAQTITLTIAGPTVWFVDNTNGLDTNKGTLASPFKTLTKVSTVDASGDGIFLYSGTYAAGVTLKASEKLVGQGTTGTTFDAVFGLTGGNAPPAGTLPRPPLATGTATIQNTVTLASSDLLRGLALSTSANSGLTGSGGLTGIDVDQTSITTSTGTGLSLNNVAGTMTLSNVSKSGSGGAIDLVSTHPALTISAGTIQNTTTNAIGINGGAQNFSYAGSITNSGGRSISLQNHTGGTVGFSGAISDSGQGIFLNSNTGSTINFSGGLTIATTTNTAFSAAGGGTLTITGTNTITTSTGTGLSVANTTVGGSGLTFQTVSTNGAANGILLDTIGAGNVTVNGGSIAGATSRGVDINSGSGNCTFANTITTSATGRSVEVTNHSGGTIAFNGAITDSGLGINLGTNTGGTINFTGGITASTGANTAFNATGGGTVTATQNNTTILNTASTSTGTALNVQNTTIGASGVTFRSITANASSANAGIALDNTGTSGSLTVTGNGGSCTSAATCTGGAINNKTGGDILTGTNAGGQTTSGTGGTGIFLRSTSNPSFTNMQLNDFSNFAVYANSVTGFSLTNSNIAGTNGSNNAGDREESAIRFDNLQTSASFPNATVSNNSIGGGATGNVLVYITSGTLNRLTMSNNTFGLISASIGNDSVDFTVYNSATGNITANSNVFNGTRSDFFETIANNNAHMDVVARQNKFSDGQAIIPGGGVALSIRSGSGGNNSTAVTTFDASCNRMNGNDANAYDTVGIFIAKGQDLGSLTGTVVNNIIGPAKANANADGLFVRSAGTGSITTLVQDNSFSGYGNAGMHFQNNDGGATMNATIYHNTLSSPNSQNFAGVFVDNGATNGPPADTSTANVVIGSATDNTKQNTLQGSGLGIDVSLSNFSAVNTHFNLSKNGSASATAAGVVADDNVGTPTVDTTGGSGPITLVNTLPTVPATPAPCSPPA
jgi:subtilisin-like proprotein convertase family protein